MRGRGQGTHAPLLPKPLWFSEMGCFFLLIAGTFLPSESPLSPLKPHQKVFRYWTLFTSSVLGFLWHSRRWRMTLPMFFPLEHKCFHWGLKQTMLVTWYLPGHTQHLYLQRSSWVSKDNVKIMQHGPWWDLRPGLNMSFTLATYTSVPIYSCHVWFGPFFS